MFQPRFEVRLPRSTRIDDPEDGTLYVTRFFVWPPSNRQRYNRDGGQDSYIVPAAEKSGTFFM
jgi:hypothetical protein